MPRKKSNEWEFQGLVLGWLNEDITHRQGLGLECATQEPSRITPQRSDIIVWRNRASEAAFLEIELKHPTTPITNPTLFRDAAEKAKNWGAPYFAIWNMNAAELYRTPTENRPAHPGDLIFQWPIQQTVTSVDDWLNPEKQELLKSQALDILEKAWGIERFGEGFSIPLEASMFVDRLSQQIPRLKDELYRGLKIKSKSDSKLRRKLKEIAAEQGFADFVDDVEKAIAGQYAYRLVGQLLFYFALGRKLKNLPNLEIDPNSRIPDSLRPYWDKVRQYDYEAIFAPSDLEQLIPVSDQAQTTILALAGTLKGYNWAILRDDVLGSIFERFIPRKERLQLGQFYTPTAVADLLVAFSINNSNAVILDPGCGSGTFLMRGYEYLRWMTGASHSSMLRRIWGFDINAFATELSVINLFRQDFSEFDNFPRVVCNSFFQLKLGDPIQFPPAQAMSFEAKVSEPIPQFDTIIGNPPYLRSQNQDDLSDQAKGALFNAAAMNGVSAPSKTDLFAFFVYKSLELLKPGGRLGFVTSSSWLTSESGATLQKVLLERFRPVTLITSEVEPFFAHAEINTVLIVAERVSEEHKHSGTEIITFVTLKRPIEEIFVGQQDYWKALQNLVDTIETSKEAWQDENIRVYVQTIAAAKLAIQASGMDGGNWGRLLRAPLSYLKIFGE